MDDAAHPATARRVLYVVPFAHLGGAETWIRHTARFHDRQRVQPVYAMLRSGPLTAAVRDSGAVVYVLEPALQRLTPSAALRSLTWLRRIIRRVAPELVHASLAYSAILAGPAAHLAGVPFVWSQHGPVTGWLHRLAGYQPAAAVFVNSEFTAAAQRQIEGPLAARLHLRRLMLPLAYGVDPDDLARATARSDADRLELRRRWGVDPAARVVGIVTRLVAWKGVDIFIRAMATLAATARDDAPVVGVIVGEAPSAGARYLHRLRALARRSDAPVLFVGPTPEPLAAIDAMDVLVNSSRQPEPFGITLIEAMCMGRIVVAPNRGGPLEIIRDGETGFLFASGDAAALAHVLGRAVSPIAQAVAQRARAEALERYLAPRGVAQLERAYDRILAAAGERQR